MYLRNDAKNTRKHLAVSPWCFKPEAICVIGSIAAPLGGQPIPASFAASIPEAKYSWRLLFLFYLALYASASLWKMYFLQGTRLSAMLNQVFISYRQ